MPTRTFLPTPPTSPTSAGPPTGRAPRPGRQLAGFTLIELLVTIVVLGLLATLAVPALAAVAQRANDRAAATELAATVRAVQAYAALEQAAVTPQLFEQALGDGTAANDTAPPAERNWQVSDAPAASSDAGLDFTNPGWSTGPGQLHLAVAEAGNELALFGVAHTYDGTRCVLANTLDGKTTAVPAGELGAACNGQTALELDLNDTSAVSGAGSISVDATPPSTPAAPTVTAGETAGELVVSWEPGSVADTGGAPISSWQLTWFDAGTQAGTQTAAAGATTATTTGLAPATAYTFTISAINIAGTGPASPASEPAMSVTAPGELTDLAAAAYGTGLLVAWTDPSTTAAPADTVHVTVTDSDGTGVFAGTPSAADGFVAVPDLDPGVYTITAYASGIGGDGTTTSSTAERPGEPEPEDFENTSTGRLGSLQHWVVPASGTYRIEAAGAAGSARGGAQLAADIELTQGTDITILVGQQATGSLSGGGGTFVVDATHLDTSGHPTPLVVAGGGGGDNRAGAADAEVAGRTQTSGGARVSSHRRDNGEGGHSGNSVSGAGGGFYTTGRFGGTAFVNGGAGHAGQSGQIGGYGGGGARNGGWGAGAGGGWTGGSADGSDSSRRFGGGGGSYTATDPVSAQSGANNDHGWVTITPQNVSFGLDIDVTSLTAETVDDDATQALVTWDALPTPFVSALTFDITPSSGVTIPDINPSDTSATIEGLDPETTYELTLTADAAGETVAHTTTFSTGGLYAFSAVTFTTAGNTGRTGPSLTQTLASYDTTANPWLTDPAFYDVAAGIQHWTVPSDGHYRIEAAGARGGGSQRYGRGAIVAGTFQLTEGDKLELLVGQPGTGGTAGHASGGGGTFVVEADTSGADGALLVAGGGGGNNSISTGTNQHGQAATSGGQAGQSGSGGLGTPGSNGSGGSGNSTAHGGAGMVGNAAEGSNSFRNGGNGDTLNLLGGFGGGGSGNSGWHRSGGGGGYSGGAGARGSTWSVAGGGGSFVSGTDQTTQTGLADGNDNAGYVTIERLG